VLKASDFVHLSPALARKLGIDVSSSAVAATGCDCADGGRGTLGPPGHDPSALADVQPPPGFSDVLIATLCSGSPDALETIPGDWTGTESRHRSGSGAYYYRSCGYFLTDFRLLPTNSTEPKLFELSGGFWDMPGSVDPEQSTPYLSEDCQRSRVNVIVLQKVGIAQWSPVKSWTVAGTWGGKCTWYSTAAGGPGLYVQQPEAGSVPVTYRVGVRARERTSGQEAYSMIRRILL
jgi:hypothetical protein